MSTTAASRIARYTQRMWRILVTLLMITPLLVVLPAAADVVLEPQEVRPLPGGLDATLMFNSNSPEVVTEEGILLSTFSSDGKRVPGAHLNLPLTGDFKIFSHHINNRVSAADQRTLYLGLLIYNPGSEKTTVTIATAASYVSQPDAPFISLPPYLENPNGDVYAGPGDRVMCDTLRGKIQKGWPRRILIQPGEGRVLASNPVRVKGLIPPINGRSTLVELQSDHRVFVAELGAFARVDVKGEERPPSDQEWWQMLTDGGLAGPRDKLPTAPGSTPNVIFGRVAGVARGATWAGRATDGSSEKPYIDIPAPGQAISYPISTVEQGTLGTGQVQSAPLVVRYPDSAYAAHGNYAVKYDVVLPLYNQTDRRHSIDVSLQSPLKSNDQIGGLKFDHPPPARVFFRGTLRVKHGKQCSQAKYVHLVLNQGERGLPLVTVSLDAHEYDTVRLELLYPPDATPPQVITIRTAEES